MSEKKALEILRNQYVWMIEMEAPDGKNWFMGVTFLQNSKDGVPAPGGIYMNVWGTVFEDCVKNKGAFTHDDALEWCSKIGMDGLRIVYRGTVRDELIGYERPRFVPSKIQDTDAKNN